jgi:hypothetical protein
VAGVIPQNMIAPFLNSGPPPLRLGGFPGTPPDVLPDPYPPPDPEPDGPGFPEPDPDPAPLDPVPKPVPVNRE